MVFIEAIGIEAKIIAGFSDVLLDLVAILSLCNSVIQIRYIKLWKKYPMIKIPRYKLRGILIWYSKFHYLEHHTYLFHQIQNNAVLHAF